MLPLACVLTYITWAIYFTSWGVIMIAVNINSFVQWYYVRIYVQSPFSFRIHQTPLQRVSGDLVKIVHFCTSVEL